MINQPTPPCTSSSICLELLDPYTCIITEIPIRLNDSILHTHELVPSFKHKGYATKLKMLNSLKRCLEELGLSLVELPNSAFKMFKVVNGAGALNTKRVQFNEANRTKKLMKGISSTNSKSINTKIHRNPLLSVGRWILSAHQKQTVEFFLKRGRRMIIADTWNMGKTVTSLACTQMSGAKKILVIVPKQLICHWAWHINQISFSMSSQPTGKNSHSKFSNKQDSKPFTNLKIIDFEQLGSDDIPENHELTYVKKTEKSEVKFKKEEVSRQNTIVYSLCSYEYLRNRKNSIWVKQKSYDCLILDQPQLEIECKSMSDQNQNKNDEKWQINQNMDREQMKKLQQIESIIICKQNSIEGTRSLLPYLNGRVSDHEIHSRYGRQGERLCNSNEYHYSLKKYYYHKNAHLTVGSPGPVVKNVLIGNYSGHSNIKCPIKLRNKTVLAYIEHSVKNRNKYQHYLVFNQVDIVEQFHKELQEMKISISMLPNRRKCQIYIGTVAHTVTHISSSNSHPENTLSIICDTNKADSTSNSISLTQSQIYQLCKYSNIEYLENCIIHHRIQNQHNLKVSTYEVERYEIKDPNIIVPYVESRAYVEKIIMEGEYISSGDQGNTKGKDPEHYEESHSSIDDNCRMVDQSEQIKQLWRTKQNISAKSKLTKERKIFAEDNQIEIMDSKSNTNVRPSRQSHQSQYKDNKVVQICLDSEQQQSNRTILNLQSNHQNPTTQPNQPVHQHEQAPFRIQLLPRHLQLQSENLINSQICVTNNVVGTIKQMQAELCQITVPPASVTVNITTTSLIDESIATTVKRRGRKRKNIVDETSISLARQSQPQTEPTRMQTRRSTRNRQEENPHKIYSVEKKQKKQEIMICEIEQNQMEQQKQDKVVVKAKEVERIASPHKQFIQILSDSSCNTMALTPKKPRFPKCRSKQVLSIKLVPELSELCFETCPPDERPLM